MMRHVTDTLASVHDETRYGYVSKCAAG